MHLCVSVCARECGCATVPARRAENNLVWSVLSFHAVGLRNQTQMIRCGLSFLYFLSPLDTDNFVNVVVGRHGEAEDRRASVNWTRSWIPD